MQIFKGFTWCVPEAFASALDSCAFNVGDVLYSDSIAYQENWKEALKGLKWSVQVKKETSAVAREGESSFHANWRRGKLTVELTDYRTGKGFSRLIETTQGKVYQTLRIGDPAALESPGCLRPQKSQQGLVELSVCWIAEPVFETTVSFSVLASAGSGEPVLNSVKVLTPAEETVFKRPDSPAAMTQGALF
jgi:hypothetical protein